MARVHYLNNPGGISTPVLKYSHPRMDTLCAIKYLLLEADYPVAVSRFCAIQPCLFSPRLNWYYLLLGGVFPFSNDIGLYPTYADFAQLP